MPDAGFDLRVIEFLTDHRFSPLTELMQAFTFIGEIEGFVLVVALIYCAFDKRLAVRLAVLVLVTMSFNHLLKTLIANPRPFIREGTYAERWAVSPAKAVELAAEYSTPSGHAMGGSAFYTYLLLSVRRAPLRAAAVVLILGTGLSRPVLGVHYVEDVLLGWCLGVPIALLAWRFGDPIARAWSLLSLPSRGLLLVACSASIWLATSPLYEPSARPLPFVSYLGFLTGVLLADPLERRLVDFDPRSAGAWSRALRVALTVAAVFATLGLLDLAFTPIAPEASALGSALRYVRYAAAALTGMLAASWLAMRLGLAETSSQPA